MTDQQVYNSMLSGLTSAQLLALGANQAQVDAALIRMAAAAQGAENPAANGQGIQAGVQALQGLANGAVLNGIRKIKVVDYHQDTIQKYVSWGGYSCCLTRDFALLCLVKRSEWCNKKCTYCFVWRANVDACGFTNSTNQDRSDQD